MCGRYASAARSDDLAQMTGARDDTGGLPASSNVAPTTTVPVLLHDTGRRDAGAQHARTRVLRAMRWGLVPHWAPSPAVGARMINARVETVADKSAFREPLRRRRCLVPATGWYEWTDAGVAGTPGPSRRGSRRPWLTHREDGQPLLMAGLWTTWRVPGEDRGLPHNCNLPDNCNLLHSVAIVTRPAPPALTWLHDRAPLLVPDPAVDDWLDQQCIEPAPLLDLLVHAEDPPLHTHPVDPAVGNVRRQEPELVRPIPLVPAESAPVAQPTPLVQAQPVQPAQPLLF